METVESRGQLQDVISKNAAEDSSYRESLIANPRGILEKHLGQELPEWMNVKIVEETADTVYLVAPHVPSEELSDEDLEMVAGGKGGGGGGPDKVDCKYNYGAFNSNITINSEVSLI